MTTPLTDKEKLILRGIEEHTKHMMEIHRIAKKMRKGQRELEEFS